MANQPHHLIEMSTYWTRDTEHDSTPTYRGTTKQFLRFFSGSPKDREELDNWLTEYDRKAIQLKWEDADKFMTFGSFLSGNAKIWYDGYMAPGIEDAPTTWPQLKQKFKEKFALPNFHNYIWSQVIHIKQAESEAAETYVTKKDALCRKIALKMEDKLMLIVDGLLPSLQASGKNVLISQPAKNIEDLCKIIELCEESLRTPPVIAHQTVSLSLPTQQPIQPDLSVIMEELNKLREEISALKSKPSNYDRRNTSYQNRNINRNYGGQVNYNNDNRDRTQYYCRYCKEEDHLIQDCQKLKKQRERQGLPSNTYENNRAMMNHSGSPNFESRNRSRTPPPRPVSPRPSTSSATSNCVSAPKPSIPPLT